MFSKDTIKNFAHIPQNFKLCQCDKTVHCYIYRHHAKNHSHRKKKALKIFSRNVHIKFGEGYRGIPRDVNLLGVLNWHLTLSRLELAFQVINSNFAILE